jgi:hypothetical protein
LEAAAPPRRRFKRQTFDSFEYGAQRLFFTVFADPTRPLGDPVVRTLLEAWRESPALAACAAQHPRAEGGLTGALALTDSLATKSGQPPGTLSIIWSGSLVGSELATCAQAVMTDFVQGAKIPPWVRAAVLQASLDFPRDEE